MIMAIRSGWLTSFFTGLTSFSCKASTVCLQLRLACGMVVGLRVGRRAVLRLCFAPFRRRGLSVLLGLLFLGGRFLLFRGGRVHHALEPCSERLRFLGRLLRGPRFHVG